MLNMREYEDERVKDEEYLPPASTRKPSTLVECLLRLLANPRLDVGRVVHVVVVGDDFDIFDYDVDDG